MRTEQASKVQGHPGCRGWPAGPDAFVWQYSESRCPTGATAPPCRCWRGKEKNIMFTALPALIHAYIFCLPHLSAREHSRSTHLLRCVLTVIVRWHIFLEPAVGSTSGIDAVKVEPIMKFSLLQRCSMNCCPQTPSSARPSIRLGSHFQMTLARVR